MAGEAAPLSCGGISNSHWRKYYYRDLYRRGAAKVQTSVHVAWINHCIARSALLFSLLFSGPALCLCTAAWQCSTQGSSGRYRVRDASLLELVEQDVGREKSM